LPTEPTFAKRPSAPHASDARALNLRPVSGKAEIGGRVDLTDHDAVDPYRKPRLLTDGRCHVAKYLGRKTHIALNRSRGSPLVRRWR
jgi:hypothetical protein